MGINSKVKILYDALKADGADVGSEQEFNDWFLRPGEDGYNNRKHVYDAFKEDGADIGESYEEFRDWLGLKAATVSSGDKANKAPTPSDPAAVSGGSATGGKATGGGKAASSTSSYSDMSFRLRRGGKDFTVPVSEVNAAGGLTEWAKANPGAPLRVYMSGDGFNGHVPLEEAHKRRKDKGYTYTLTDPAKSQGKTWQPTPMQKAFMAHSIQSQVDQFKASTDAMLERSQNTMDYYRGGGGITGAPVKGKVKVNPKSGAVEQTYLTPTGTATADRGMAERETRAFNESVVENMTVAGQLRRAGRDLERITQQLERRRAEIIDEVRRRQEQKDNNKSLSGRIYEGITGGDGMVQTGGSFMSEVNQILATDREYRALEASRRKAQERVRTIQHENDRQSGKDVGFWRGFGEIVGDWRTWDFGYGDLQDAITLHSISNSKSGERSKEENEVLEQTAEAQAAQAAYGQNDSFWNRAGVMTGEMLPFMLDFALMGGARSGTSAVTRTIDAALLKTLRSAAPKVARNKAAQWTVKVLGAMPEDLLYRAPLMTNTVQGMKTASDIIDRKLGDVVVREDGTYDFSNDKTWGSAIWQGEANAIIENYSEMFGAHLEGVLSLNTLSKIADTFGAKRLSGILAKASSSELAGIAGTMQKHLSQLGLSDYFGEVGEEYYGQLWRTMLNLDDAYKQNPDGSRTNLFLDGQFHGDIWGGMALSMGLMGAGKYTLSAAAYGSMKHKVNKTDTRAAGIFTPEVWEGWRDRIDNTTNADIGAMAESIIADTSLTPEQRDAAMNYMEASLNLRGFNLASVARQRGGEQTAEEAAANESYMDGYAATTPQEMNDAKRLLDLQRGRLASALSDDMVQEYDADPIGALSRTADPELRRIAADYVNAKQVYDGMIQRVRDDIDVRIAQSDAEIESRVNRETGMIQPATMKIDDRAVYIVNGTVSMYEDGTGVDTGKSSESIIIRDAETGKIEFADPSQVLNVGEGIDAEAEKEAARNRITQETAKAAADNIDGVISFAPGESYSVLDLDGNQEPITILGQTADEEGLPLDGYVDIQYADGTIQTVATSDLQQWVDAANDQRVAQFADERATERAAADEAERQADETGLSNPNRDRSLLPDNWEMPYYGFNTTASRYIESERGTGGILYQDEQGNDAIVISAIDDNNYVGYFREYDEQGQPTNRWSAKFQNGSGLRENHRDMMQTAQELLPAGHELTEHTSVSTDGLRNLANQLKHGYEIQHDEQGNVVTNRVAVNMMARENDLGLPESYFRPGSEANIRIRLEDEERAEVNARLAQFLAPFGLDESAIHWEGNKLYVDHPVLRRADTPQQEADPGVTESDEIVLNTEENAENGGQGVPKVEEFGDGGIIITPDIALSDEEVAAALAGEETTPSTATEETPPSALSQIPTDEKGDPIYEQAEPETAWDALMEETEDEQIAQNVIAQEIAEREDALKKLEKQKPKAGLSTREKIQAEKDKKKAMDDIRRSIDHWKRMSTTKQRRQAEADAIRNEEARRRAEERRAQEEQARAEREEAERQEREALNGVPDWSHDTPQDARARGYRRFGPEKVDRQEPLTSISGKDVEVKFGESELPRGKAALIDVSSLQPSHIDGMRNPRHFLDEAQPKERTDVPSREAARKIASNIRPEEITSSVTAYTGAPTVNSRGETIQGNSRSDALRTMYESYPEQAAKYKQYLIDHAADFGLSAEQVEGMEKPVLVNMLDVADDEAIRLGQFVAQDTESGGIERIKPKNAVKKMGNKIRSFANILLRSSDDEASLSQLVDTNGVDVLKWMAQQGFISDTQYASAFDSKGHLTGEAANDLKGILYQSIFTGGSTRLEEMFNNLPAKAQRAILATAFRDYDSSRADRMVEEIQQSIMAYNDMMYYEAFASASNIKEATGAMESWKRQYAMDDVTGEPYLPAEKFSNFALALAAIYKGGTQRFIQQTFNDLYDTVQGTAQDTLFEEADKTPKPLAEAIKKVLDLEYQPIKQEETNDNGSNGSDAVDLDTPQSETGGPGSDGNAENGEREPDGGQSADSGAGTSADSGEGNDVAPPSAPTSSSEDSLFTPEEIKAICGHTFTHSNGDVVKLTGHTTLWDGRPAFIGTLNGAKGGRFMHNLVKIMLDKWQHDVALPTKQEETPKQETAPTETQTPEEQEAATVAEEESMLERMDIQEDDWDEGDGKHPTHKRTIVIDGKHNVIQVDAPNEKGEYTGSTYEYDGRSFSDLREVFNHIDSTPSLGQKIEEAEAEVDTNPTEPQKAAGNYKKGHVQVGTFDVTIENPKGSKRSGTDPDGKKWETTMTHTYGYIRGTEGVDGDHIDVYLSSDIGGWNGRKVFVVDQYNPDGSFDEHKVMLGFNDKAEAIEAYLSNYEDGWEKGRRLVFSTVSIEDFEKWIESSHRKQKPFNEYKSVHIEDTHEGGKDELHDEVRQWLGKKGLEPDESSRSAVMRYFKIGYNRAGKIINAIAEENAANQQEEATPTQEETASTSTEGYTITSKPYTNKQGKTDTHLVTFDRDFSKEEQKRIRAMAKEKKGWQDRETGGYMLRSREDAEEFAASVMSLNVTSTADAPVSLSDIESAIKPAETEISTSETEISSPETAKTDTEKEISSSPADKPADAAKPEKKPSKWVDEEDAEEFERLRNILRNGLGQLNMGFPPELLYAGAKMSYLMMKHGVRKFAEYAAAMIEELGDAIRPHLKALYNFTRSTDEVTSSEWAGELTPFDEVMKFDTANFDKGEVSAMAAAENVVAEEESQQHLEDTVSTIKETIRQNPDGTTTQTINEGGTEIEVTEGDFIPGVYPPVDDKPTKPGKKKPSKPKPTEPKQTTGQLDLFGEEEEQIINDVIEDTTAPEPKPEAELSGDSADYQERSRQERDLVDDIVIEIMKRTDMKERGDDRGALTMRDIRGMLENYPLLADISATDLQELVERAMTILTRTAAKTNQADPRKGYDRVVAYYNMQPSLNARDSERLIKQQYSTPTPFGYVMGQFVNAKNDVKSVLEPSAGNGALTIMFDPATVHVNDIDERRLENLRTLGYGKVTAQNGLLPFEGEKVDGVLTNPPFGSVTEKVFDGVFKISSIEGQMAINALDSMKDGGRAAIIIGGNTSYRTNGSMNPKDAAFFGYLYSHYNVVDVINISGKALYARNGTGYDVRMILINGRKPGEFSRVYPPVKSKARAEQVTTFDELYKRVQDDIQQVFQMGHKPADEKPEGGRSADGGESAPVRSGSNRPDKGAGQRPGTTGNGSGSASGSHIEQPAPGNKPGRPVGVDNGNGGNAGGTDDVQRPKPATSGSNGSGSTQNDGGGSGGNGRDATPSRPNGSGERLAVKPDLTTEKVPYPNQSDNGFTLLSVVPAAQAEVLQRSLAEIGDVDQFLVDELGYSSKEELYSYLAAEQIDSVALAIHQMNKGNAFIIGDMTGVGKGRQGAALIRYGVRQGRCPIYFTQKPTLFTDNYRDLADIGSSELRPFIIASNPKDANIVDANGNVVHKLPSKKEQERVFNYIMQNGKLPKEYDYVLTTYDQIKNGTADYSQNEDGTWNTEARKLPKKSKGYTTADYNGQARRDALARLAMGVAPGEGNIAILDESHTVGGDSGCGRYMQMLTSGAYGVTFLSATFAKRADNMPIYAQRTAIAEAGVNANELIEAIAKGGVTLQEIMSKQLVESGQMIRRERSFEGVTIDWLSVEEETDRKQREQFNEVANIFNSIRNFQNDFIKPIIDGMNEAAAEQGATVGQTQGTKDLGVRNTPFASKMYNLVNQLLFALKVDAVADRVIENLRNGFKPVISFTNTMEGFLASAPKGVAMDEVPNFSLTLMRALDGVMRFTENDADQNSEGGQITLSQLSPEGQKAYNEVKEKIMNLSADLPISPMDAIRMKIEEAGYTVAEITGRTTQLNRTEDGRYIVEGRKDRDKKAAMRDFNAGKLDVLMINKSGSTGISLHASSKFEDQRQRVMVFAQFQSDINDEVQMRGRIDRSGQVVRGRYEYIMSTIPAEQRIQMMFKAKLKSLDANTTSSQKSKFNEMEIVDYLNKYGDEVVWEYMKEHPELSDRLGDPLKMLQDKDEDGSARTSEKEDNSQKSDCAGKISRYLAFLSVEEQDEIFKEITEAYKVKIQLLDDAGENDLEITTMPLRAETKSKQIWHKGENPGSGNAFADNTYVEEVEVDVLKKPMKRTEIEDMTRKLMGDKLTTATEYDQTRYGMKEGELNWGRYADKMIEEVNNFFGAKADDAVAKMKEAGEKRVAKAREKAVKDAIKARAKGENTFSDQEIEALADVVAKEAQDKEEIKQYRRREEINNVRDHIKHLLGRLRAGHIYVVPQDLKQATADMFTQTFGTFVGFKFNKSYTLGSSTAIFATLDGRRKVELALNDKAIETIIRCTDTALRYSPKEISAISMDNWDSKVPTKTRQTRHIITGNLLQALVDTEKGEKTKGNLISFSTIDGNTRQGILMSENFKPTDLRSSVPLRSRLKQIQDGMTVVSENGDVQIERVDFDWKHRGEYELKVPKSKQRGGIYTMHPELLKLIDGHNFNSKGNYMVGYVLPENLAKVVDMLSRAPFNLTVLEESKLTEAKESTESSDEELRFRPVEDPNLAAELDTQPSVKAYRAMQVIDGQLYSPMASGTKKTLSSPYQLNQWDVATELAFNFTDEMMAEVERLNNSTEKGYVEVIPGQLRFVKDSKGGKCSLRFHLKTDETDVWAAYNPYNHNSDSMLNDQFKAAYRRGNLVVVEAEVPIPDLESGYHAQWAKDPTGKAEWKSGDVAAQLPDEMKRTVYLSRYCKPVRVLDNKEVAKWIGDRLKKAEKLTGKKITLYEACFHPEVKRLLEKQGFSFVPVKPTKGKTSKILSGHRDYMNDAKIAELNKSLGAKDEWLSRQGDGEFTDDEISLINDPWSRAWGKTLHHKKQRKAYAERQRNAMREKVRSLTEPYGIEVEIREDASGLEGKKRTAKGWFDPRTGKIVIVLDNHSSTADIQATLLHEMVAHKGLRDLFGDKFDAFLDAVYANADNDVKERIDVLATRNGWNRRTATEEYMAGLAEDGSFKDVKSGWWQKLKGLFMDFLRSCGFSGDVKISDNELRYVLWMSYENLREPGRFSGILGEAARVTKEAELGVGEFSEEAMRHYEGDGKATWKERAQALTDTKRAFEKETDYAQKDSPRPAPKDTWLTSTDSKAEAKVAKISENLKRLEEQINSGALGVNEMIFSLAQTLGIKHPTSGKSNYAEIEVHGVGATTIRISNHSAEPTNFGRTGNNVGIVIKTGNHRFRPNGGIDYVELMYYGDKVAGNTELQKSLISGLRHYIETGDFGHIPEPDRLNTSGAYREAMDNLEGEPLFRDGDFTPRDRVTVAHVYEKMVAGGSWQFMEAMQDSMLGLKTLYEAVLTEGDKHRRRGFRIEDVAGYENAYLYENRMSSANNGEQHQYFTEYMKPLLNSIHDLCGSDVAERRILTDYMMAKHGLERNGYMRNEAAAAGEETDRDFAGLCGLTGENDWQEAERKAQEMVDEYEADHDISRINQLWSDTKRATTATLEKIYLTGLISEDTFNKVLGMYEYYIPLRGWDETTSDEVYGYLTSKDGPLMGNVFKTAKGRESKADDPIATIAKMADDAIRQGNRNVMKQRFLNFVHGHPSDLVSVNQLWLQYNDVKDEWEPVFADLEPDMTAAEVASEIAKFEAKMESLKAAEPDKYKRGRDARNIPYRVKKGDLREHQVLVKRNGHTYVLTINGNPRAAQALNGLTNPDVETGGVIGNLLKAGEYINRQLSAFYTTRNPDFVVSNFLRDMLYSNIMTWVKENPRYALQFLKNFGKFSPLSPRRALRLRHGAKGGTVYSIGMLLRKWEKGTLDESDKYEKMFKEFMLNGGETGYTSVKDIEGHKRTIAAELKKQGSAGRKAWAALGMQLDLLNRSVENCARFAAYVTSREMGRSIDRSIYDAKEISVNFNKKGSGGKFVNATGQTTLGKVSAYLSGGGRIAYVFWNAGVQGMTNFGRAGLRNPKKGLAGAAALFTLGYVIPLLAQLFGGGDGDDDDKNAYYNLPEYIRRSNICFKAGGQWITIPLPIEFRAIYGLGELATGVISGNERYGKAELARQIAAQVSQILPLDMLEGGGGISPFIPSAFKPMTEAYVMNKGWTGLPVYKDTPFNRDDPEWKRVYQNTDQHLVEFTRWLNERTGGNDYKKGAIDINPAKLEYLLNGTFGGVMTFPMKGKKSLESAFGDRDFEWRNTPLLNRVVKSGDERTANRKLQNEYYKYREEATKTEHEYKGFQKEGAKGILESARKADFIYNSEEFLRYQIMEYYEPTLEKIRDRIKEAPEEEKIGYQGMYYSRMRELVDALHDPEEYLKSIGAEMPERKNQESLKTNHQ